MGGTGYKGKFCTNPIQFRRLPMMPAPAASKTPNSNPPRSAFGARPRIKRRKAAQELVLRARAPAVREARQRRGCPRSQAHKMEQLFDAVGCCSADVYEDREAARFVEGDEDVQPLLPDRCAEVLGLASPEASYMDRRKAYIRAALVFSRLVGPVAPWREKRGFERRGAHRRGRGRGLRGPAGHAGRTAGLPARRLPAAAAVLDGRRAHRRRRPAARVGDAPGRRARQAARAIRSN